MRTPWAFVRAGLSAFYAWVEGGLVLRRRRRSRSSLLLLQAEFDDGRRDVVAGLLDHAPQLRRGRGHRNRAGLLDQDAVFRRGDDRTNAAIEQIYDGLRRASSSADAEPAIAYERHALLGQGGNLRRAREPLRAGNAEYL